MSKSKRNVSSRAPVGGFFTLELGHDYHVVSGHRVEHLGLSAVIVAPSGLVALHSRRWEGRISVDARGVWRSKPTVGKPIRLQSPEPPVLLSDRRLQTLLRREAPAMQVKVFHLIVCTNANVDLSDVREAWPQCVTVGELSELLKGASAAEQAPLEPAECELLNQLLSGKVTHLAQKVAPPFEYRALGIWGLSHRGSSVHAVARYLAKHPEEGLQDLRSGALEHWFAEIGAPRLVALAREIALQPQPSTRVAIETFLVRSGLSPRPTISVHPRRVDMGHVVVGETSKASVQIRKGRGPGYLHGTLETNNQWIKVSPASFEGSVNAVVTLDASGLSVTQKALQAMLIVRSNASEQPLSFPIINHVHPEPAPGQRYLFRPVVGAAVAGGMGAALGLVSGWLGLAVPAWSASVAWLPTAAPAFYASAMGALWALFGVWRGLGQGRAWPIGYALRRWLARVGLWAVIPGAIVTVWYELIVRQVPGWQEHIGTALLTVLPLLACLAVIPGTIGELSAARRRADLEPATRVPWRRRLGQVVSAALVVAALLVGSLFVYRPLGLQRSLMAGTESARNAVEQRSQSLQDKLDKWLDEAYIRLYDRRSGSGN